MNDKFAKDLIELVNQLKGLPKTKSVEYNTKDKDGNWHKTTFNYTPLDDILEKVKENQKFALLQPLTMTDGVPTVNNILIHETGERVESGPFTLYIDKASKMQEIGAVITYTRRYSIGSFLGIATEEDADAQIDSKPTDLKATEKQVGFLKTHYTGENLEKLLKANNIEKLEDIQLAKASELIGKIKATETTKAK